MRHTCAFLRPKPVLRAVTNHFRDHHDYTIGIIYGKRFRCFYRGQRWHGRAGRGMMFGVEAGIMGERIHGYPKRAPEAAVAGGITPEAQAEPPQQQAETPRLAYHAKECAAMFGVSRATWGRWVRCGRMPQPIRIGGAPMWLAEDIEAWLKRLRKEAHRVLPPDSDRRRRR